MTEVGLWLPGCFMNLIAFLGYQVLSFGSTTSMSNDRLNLKFFTGGSRFSVITPWEVKMFTSDGWSETIYVQLSFERLLNHPNRVSGYRVTAG